MNAPGRPKLKPVRSRKARNEMVENNKGLAYAFVRKMYYKRPWLTKYLDEDDACQASLIGLMRAAELWCKNLVSKHTGAPVGFSTYANFWIRQAVNLALRGGQLIRGESAPLVFLKSTLKEEDGVHFDPPCGDNPIVPSDVMGLLEMYLSRLLPRDELVLRRRFLDGKCLREVGEELGVHKERVRQLQERALEQLRRHMARDGLTAEKLGMDE